MELNKINERKRKATLIINLYQDRKMSQSDIAEALRIPLQVVACVTQEFNYKNTILKTQENRKEGETINMVLDYTAMFYLDKYDF